MTTTLPPSGDTPAELAEHLASGARLVEAFHLMPGVARAMREAARLLRKPCTCHPDDSPPFPCPRKYALSECRAAAPPAVQSEPTDRCKHGIRFPHECNDCLYEAPAVQAEPVAWLKNAAEAWADDNDDLSADAWRSVRQRIAMLAAPPVNDEAVRLLREARKYGVHPALRDEIDAYLAKVGDNDRIQPRR